jgi:hypothetical protein
MQSITKIEVEQCDLSITKIIVEQAIYRKSLSGAIWIRASSRLSRRAASGIVPMGACCRQADRWIVIEEDEAERE